MARSPLFAFVLASSVAPSFARAQTLSPIGEETRWTLAAVGDVIMNRRLASFDHQGDPAFHEMANVIREADAAFEVNPVQAR